MSTILKNDILTTSNNITLEEFRVKKQEFLTGEKTFNAEEYISVIQQHDTEIGNLNTTLQNLEYSLASRNSELKMQKQISLMLGIALSIVAFIFIIKKFKKKK